MRHRHSLVLERQEPLRQRYRQAPQEAWIVDRAATVGDRADDAFHGTLAAGNGFEDRWRFGIHRAVGGGHDAPNPGDILCAALAACQDSTLRIVAERLGVRLESVAAEATAEVDVRGTLAVGSNVPVGFQRMACRVAVRVARGTDPGLVEKLCFAAERGCVVLQTLRRGIDVRVQFEIES